MRRTLALVVCTLSACSFTPNQATPGDDTQHPDADTNPGGDGSGSNTTGSDANLRVCIGTLYQACKDGPLDPIAVDQGKTLDIDTEKDTRCVFIHQANGGHDLCAIMASTLTVNGKVHGHGKNPLMLASDGDLTVSNTGVVDLSSTFGNEAAGANGPGCNVKTPDQAGQDGAGGGAGGSFQFKGGDAGDGTGAKKGDGGKAQNGMTATDLKIVRGGCAGEDGATTAVAEFGFNGGPGGGAVLLASNGKITIAGKVLAGGGGGLGTLGPKIGGGGGGAGGFIGFDAAGQLSLTGTVVADGGAGGGGGGANATSFGAPGGDANANATAANGGGGGGTNGGDGGNTQVGNEGAVGAGANGTVGGGGGGAGGAGFIFNFGSTHSGGAVISPTITVSATL